MPKVKKGKQTVPVHPICHKTIHLHFTNGELARFGADRARLLDSDALAKFVSWIASKPADFDARVR